MIKETLKSATKLAEIVRDIFGESLENLHNKPTTHFPSHDQDTWAHKYIYNHLTQDFSQYYDYLAHDVATRFLLDPKKWVVQSVPTFRFQFPGIAGTREWHRDRDYNHPVETLNVIVPLTRMAKTTAVWAEIVPFTHVFEELSGEPGEIILFNGAMCKHGSYSNKSGQSRVSCDFRLVESQFVPKGKTTVSAKRQMIVGDYYKTL